MWTAHVKELACPGCRALLRLPDDSGDGTATERSLWLDGGELACSGCAAQYPIRDGVPRLFATAIDKSFASPTGGAARIDPRTQAAFGFEWLRYPVTSRDEDLVTLLGLTGVDPLFYEQVHFRNLFAYQPTPADVAASDPGYFLGKRVLEGGAGMGKYVAVVARSGAALAVGLDASEAVQRSARLNRENPNALIVQGDLFNPPLAGTFDFVYSVGVLHHTPDAHQAFRNLSLLVAPDGELAVWLYPHAGDPFRQVVEFWHERIARPLTSRLPHTVLETLCGFLGRATALKTRLREHGGPLRDGAARLINLVAVGEHLDPKIGAFLNFDWYSPPYRSRHTFPELVRWYHEAGFEIPRELPVAVSGIARRLAPRAI